MLHKIQKKSVSNNGDTFCHIDNEVVDDYDHDNDVDNILYKNSKCVYAKVSIFYGIFCYLNSDEEKNHEKKSTKKLPTLKQL